MQYYEFIILNYNQPKNQIFTYQTNSEVKIGDICNLTVRNKDYFGLCYRRVKKPHFKCKEAVLTIKSGLNDVQLKTLEYIQDYYFCGASKAASLFISSKILKPRSIKKLAEPSINTNTYSDQINLQELNIKQKEIFDSINSSKENFHLIHGITGSGKTEIYFHLIAEKIKNKQDVLFLVPQISLLPQMQERLQAAFPETPILPHSHKLSNSEFVENFNLIRTKDLGTITISSRSGLFLPFANLGLIIMDEEHDFAYKQEVTPKYHARTICQHLSKLHNCQMIMGSATPSLESYQASDTNKINYHYLDQKFKNVNPPDISVVDLSNHLLNNPNNYLSLNLKEAIQQSLENKKQILLLSNRRGYSNFITCMDCKTSIECNSCSSTFTVHKSRNHHFLKCHYCNLKLDVPLVCASCKSVNLKHFGTGIQSFDETLQQEFPNANIIRIDSDNTSQKNAHQEIHEKLKSKEFDIILGTQMVAQGLDLKRLNLVGVIFAEENLNLPDFRTHERLVQLLNQVVGRTGRHTQDSKVIIQTLNPENPLFFQFLDKNIRKFFTEELIKRKNYNFPPYSRLTKLEFRNLDQNKLNTTVKQIEKVLQEYKIHHNSVSPLIYKKNNQFTHHIFINSLQPERILSKLNLNTDCTIDRDPLSTI